MLSIKQKLKVRSQIKAYQEKIKDLRGKLKAKGVTDEGVVSALNDEVLKGGKAVKDVIKGGMSAKANRGKKPDVVKTWATPPVLPALSF
jgi:hypothetical protein